MKNKIICILVGMLLFATVFSVTGTKINEKNEVTNEVPSCGLAPIDMQSVQLKDNNGMSLGEGDTFYAFCAYDSTSNIPVGPIEFQSDAPGTVTSIAPSTASDFIAGGCWAEGVWYGSEYSVSNSNIWTIDESSGAMTMIGQAGTDIHGMAYDPSSGNIYGSSPYALYTIDMDTGAATLVGSFSIGGELVIAIACDADGNIYAHDIVTDSIYSVDSNSGQATLIGLTGLSCNFAQDMAFDKNNDILYLSAYTSQGELYTCDVSTGTCTIVGAFENGIETTAFAIPSGAQSELEIEIRGGFGVHVTITNIGEEDATDVEWLVEISGGMFGGINISSEGSRATLALGETIRAAIPFIISLGLIEITATADASNAPRVTDSKSGYIILFFVIGLT